MHPRVTQRIGEARFYYAYGRQRANAQWRLRHAKVGQQATIVGRPTVEATDLTIGDHFKIWSGYRRTLISGWGKIRIGDRVFINSGVVLFSVLEVSVGDDVAIANEAYITDTDSHGVAGRPARSEPIRIGDGTWIGARAIVLPGVSIGSRCVVAAGAVVSRSMPADSLIAGNPARVVRELDYPPNIVRAWHDG
ncbi:MAG TPA: acyltransferase [Mycobacteriales bacterium]|nr:acyltransferase [Mycobacteriales bacterium]